MKHYLSIKKNEISPYATTRMDLESNMPSKISQAEKDRCYMTSLYMWKLKIKTNEQTKQVLIDTESKMVVARREGSGLVGKIGKGD